MSDEKVFEGTVEETETGTAIERVEKSELVLGSEVAHEVVMRRASTLKALREITLKSLSPKDFHFFGDNPWLEASGVAKVSEVFGVHFTKPIYTKEWRDRFDEETQEVIKNSHFVYLCEITAILPIDGNRSYPATGTASTRDDFYMRDKKHPHPLNVDEDDVRKKAETNARARCLIGLGLASYSAEELNRIGFDRSKTTGHDYKTPAPQGSPSEKQWEYLDSLIEKKVVGIEPEKIQEFLRKPMITGKQATCLIQWLKAKADGSIDNDDQFKPNYDDIIAGKFYVKEDKK